MYLALRRLVSEPPWQNAIGQGGGLVLSFDATSSGCAAFVQAVLEHATTHHEEASVLAFGEWPRRDGARSPSKDVRLIVVASAAAVLGACASFGEVSPFHRGNLCGWELP